MSIGDIFKSKTDAMKELDDLHLTVMKEQMQAQVTPRMVYDTNTMQHVYANGTATNAKPLRSGYKSTTLSLQITPVANGYVVGEMGCVDQFVCITMDDVKDRVIALLAAHHMDLQT